MKKEWKTETPHHVNSTSASYIQNLTTTHDMVMASRQSGVDFSGGDEWSTGREMNKVFFGKKNIPPYSSLLHSKLTSFRPPRAIGAGGAGELDTLR